MWSLSEFIYSPVFLPIVNGLLSILVFKYFLGITDMPELYKLGLIIAGVSFVSTFVQNWLGAMWKP